MRCEIVLQQNLRLPPLEKPRRAEHPTVQNRSKAGALGGPRHAYYARTEGGLDPTSARLLHLELLLRRAVGNHQSGLRPKSPDRTIGVALAAAEMTPSPS